MDPEDGSSTFLQNFSVYQFVRCYTVVDFNLHTQRPKDLKYRNFPSWRDEIPAVQHTVVPSLLEFNSSTCYQLPECPCLIIQTM